MTISNQTKVGLLAAEHPHSTRVLARYGIDFCCGGGRALETVCEEMNLDVNQVVREIEEELASTGEDARRWDTASSEELISHILETYHAPLKEELPRLAQMAQKVKQVHYEKDPEGLTELVEVYDGLKSELEHHMLKEEQILFPMILSGQGSMAHGPISVMEHEHESAGSALKRIRELTRDYTVPAEACNTWRALWHGLAALEESLHQHIHLENNILFPRALNS